MMQELIVICKKNEWFERREAPRRRIKEGQVSTRSRSSHVAMMTDGGYRKAYFSGYVRISGRPVSWY